MSTKPYIHVQTTLIELSNKSKLGFIFEKGEENALK